MKYLIILLIALISFSFSLYDLTDDIANYLKQSNTSELVKNFQDKVSIKILDQEDLLSKEQSQALIQDFFTQHKVKNYTTSHTSIVNGDQQFITGTLETTDGKYRVSILIRTNASKSLISQFRIEKDNG
jgi:LAS superfamily LD-carboxypeptidase LdcB